MTWLTDTSSTTISGATCRVLRDATRWRYTVDAGSGHATGSVTGYAPTEEDARRAAEYVAGRLGEILK